MEIERFLRLPEVQQIAGLGATQIWQLEQQNNFPRRIKISERAAGWLLSEINQWVEHRVAMSRVTPPVPAVQRRGPPQRKTVSRRRTRTVARRTR